MKNNDRIMNKTVILGLMLLVSMASLPLFAKDKDKPKTPKISYEVDIDYPVFEAEPLLNAQLAQLVQRELQNFNKEFFAAETPAYSQVFEFKIDHDPIYEDTAYISFLLSIYRYTGGAHGETSLIPITYSKQTKKLLSLEDVIQPARKDWLSVLSAEARKQLTAQVQARKLASSDDWITQGTVPQKEHFAVFKLEKNGIRFVFNQYQVAPYSSGMPEITVPFTLFK